MKYFKNLVGISLLLLMFSCKKDDRATADSLKINSSILKNEMLLISEPIEAEPDPTETSSCTDGYYTRTPAIPFEWSVNSSQYISNGGHNSSCNRAIFGFTGTSFLGDRARGFLGNNQSIVSQNGGYKLVMQSDGNVVLYNNYSGVAMWRTNTVSGVGTYRFVCQADGNMVLYKNPTPTSPGVSLWQSSTIPSTQGVIAPLPFGKPEEAYLYLQDDGNLVMYYPSLQAGQVLSVASTGTAGGKISSHNGRFRSSSGYTY